MQRDPNLNPRLGRVPSFVAGATNAGGFLAVGRYTSHMTGIASSMADDLMLGHADLALAGLASLLEFLLSGLVGALGFKYAGCVTTVPLAGLLWLLSLRHLLDDWVQRGA